MASALPHVLIAEDNALVSDALRVLFEATGHTVSVAGEVSDVIAIASNGSVDLLLLDLGLTGGDGFDVLAAIRESASKPRVTVALTGRDDPAVAQRCREAGCTAVLLKPVPTRDLIRLSSEWLAAT